MALYGGITLPGHPDLENVRKLDLLPVPFTRRAHRLGIAIDPPYFNDLTSTLQSDMALLRRNIAHEIPAASLDRFCSDADYAELSAERDTGWSPINVESSVQLATLLFDVLGIGKGRDLKRTSSGDRISTGKKQLEILKREHPVVQLILDYRERSKLVNTYSAKLPKIAKFHPRGRCCPVCELPHVGSTWRVHTEFTMTRTDTGRLASKNPNLQNIPARTKLGRMIRAGFIASPGTRLLSWDFSQIELRLLAHAACERALIDIFERNQDPHLRTACSAFPFLDYDHCYSLLTGKDAGTLTQTQKDEWGNISLLYRAPCKNVNFGVVYGLQGQGLLDLMAVTYATAGLDLPTNIDLTWCDEFIKSWFALYPGVSQYMAQQHYRARRYNMVWDMFGRIRLVPESESVLSWIKEAGLRQAGNMPIQADSAGLMKLAMGETDEMLCRVLESGVWCWPLLSIHDEQVLEVAEDYAEGMGSAVGDIMDNVMVDRQTGRNLCRVKIQSDGKVMQRWVKG